MVHGNVELETQLIDDLLDVNRIVHGKLTLQREPVDLHACVRQALEVCAEDFRAKNVELDLALRAEPHQVLGEAARLRQV